ncbi:MAG TPA: hypothetical protein VEA16_14000 [Vicinamibacterales bacterium]|nr:hypothetical protein [Vicinamibacterales bacterium]
MDEQQEILTLRQRTHDLANAVSAAVTRIEVTATKLEYVGPQLDRIEAACTKLADKVDSHTGRLTTLETRADESRISGRNWGLSAGGIGTAIGAALAYFFGGSK